MQTFLPYADFQRSAAVLDMKRLGKQRVECKQIYIALTSNEKYGWKNHPAIKMWRNKEGMLALYGYDVCAEWIRRGYQDSLLPYFKERIVLSGYPDWFGYGRFHDSHKSNLLRKMPDHYKSFWPHIPSDLPYYWPQ